MVAGGGKSKGSAFEREICEKLSLWISDQKSRDLFWRTAGSGSRATMKQKRGHKKEEISQPGDIISIAPEGTCLTDRFIIECKFYKDLGIQSLIYGKPKEGTIVGFWNKLCDDCAFFGKRPMLIAKQNAKPILLFLGKHQINFQNFDHLPKIASFPDLVVFFFDDFIQNVKFQKNV